jgi:hypothetical protein
MDADKKSVRIKNEGNAKELAMKIGGTEEGM